MLHDESHDIFRYADTSAGIGAVDTEAALKESKAPPLPHPASSPGRETTYLLLGKIQIRRYRIFLQWINKLYTIPNKKKREKYLR